MPPPAATITASATVTAPGTLAPHARIKPAAAAAVPAARVRGGALTLAGILLVAVNLRAAITSLGALLPEVTAGLQLSATTAGLITTIPVLSFAVFGPFTPWLARRFSPARVLVAAMLVLAAGQLLRALTDSTLVFLITSALALSGIAVANVLLPGLVKQYFPGRTGVITGVYTMTLIAGASAAAAAAVPIAYVFGSWRAGLGVWALLAAVASLPWLGSAVRRTRAEKPSVRTAKPRLRVGRTRLGWAMALYFGMQSLSGYAVMGWLAQLFRDASFSPATAGLLLAGVTGIGVPIALLMPTLAGRRGDLRSLVLMMSSAMLLAYVGLAIAPGGPALLWVALLAVGQGAFPLALAMIGMRARTQDGVVALSAFAQSVGYLLAALGPLLVGALYEITGGWTMPLGFLIAAAVVQLCAGLAVARPRAIEDEAAR